MSTSTGDRDWGRGQRQRAPFGQVSTVVGVLLAADGFRPLGSDQPRLVFGEEPKAEGTWAGSRVLLLDERPAFELSFWCGTCPFLFKRLEGARSTVSLSDTEVTLARGVESLDDGIIGQFAALLPRGEYLPLLLEVAPRLRRPVEPGDYFSEEQVATWGADGFWGLPEYPQTPYYRTFETRVDAEAHLFEFVVPMVPPSWGDPAKVAVYAEELQRSSSPTAVAVSTLDICQPAVDTRASDYYAHWGLTHFLLDGHHKLVAAAQVERPLRLLSLVSAEASLASKDDVARLRRLRRQQPATRGA